MGRTREQWEGGGKKGGDVQMVCLDALRPAVNRDVAGLLYDHGEEEL